MSKKMFQMIVILMGFSHLASALEAPEFSADMVMEASGHTIPGQ